MSIMTNDSQIDTASVAAALAGCRAAVADRRTRPADWRRRQLRALLAMFDAHADEFESALAADMGKPSFEGWLTDIASCRSEIEHMLKHLDSWMRPRKVRVSLVAQPGKATVVSEPLGCVLVIAPWNYPIQLLVNPLAAALAAGNAVVAKPSELAPACSSLLARLLPEYLDAVTVVQGGPAVTQALLSEPFDHIFFTGSTNVGRVVMAAAAAHLTPVTLELGGKSPAVVDSSARLAVAARRIAWGKFLNAGQTCIAPDYVLVQREHRDAIVDAIGKAIGEFYGADVKASKDYGRIINDRHVARLSGLLDDDHGGTVAFGGDVVGSDRFVAPTVVVDPRPDSAMMTDEIFGPILPVISVVDRNEAIEFVNARPKPLALYAFADDAAAVDDIVARTTAGGVCVNHALLHFAVADLPFGGVGASGMGRYHGRSGFDTFSNSKPVLYKRSRPDPSISYPPYSAWKRRILSRLL
jgi:aldehyde dehydrogenase (NAD+)